MRLLKMTNTRVKMNHAGHNKHCPDITMPYAGAEYAMAEAPVKAYYYSERLAERNKRHETLENYENELDQMTNYIPHRELNPKLEHARSVKIARHRDMLPQLLF
jgi:hypothetical protein